MVCKMCVGRSHPRIDYFILVVSLNEKKLSTSLLSFIVHSTIMDGVPFLYWSGVIFATVNLNPSRLNVSPIFNSEASIFFDLWLPSIPMVKQIYYRVLHISKNIFHFLLYLLNGNNQTKGRTDQSGWKSTQKVSFSIFDRHRKNLHFDQIRVIIKRRSA